MRSERLASRALLLLVLGAAAACGGAQASDLFGGGGGGNNPSDSGTDLDAASTDDGATTGDAGGGGKDGAVDKDAGRPPDPDASVPDTGKPNADPGISCGQTTSGEINCNPATQYCCATASGGSAVALECKATTVSLCSGVKIGCDDSADCPTSQYCCGTFTQNTGYTKIACSTNPACGTPSGGTTYVRFCDPTAVPSECAADGKTCTGQSGSIPGYTYCK